MKVLVVGNYKRLKLRAYYLAIDIYYYSFSIVCIINIYVFLNLMEMLNVKIHMHTCSVEELHFQECQQRVKLQL